MTTPALTTGCLKEIMSGDGAYEGISMLSTQLNHLVVEGQLPEFTIIKVQQHITSVVNKNENDDSNSRRVLIIVALEVLKNGSEVGEKIGNPVNLSEAAKAKPAAAPEPPRSVLSSSSNVLPPPRTQKPQANMNETAFDSRVTIPINGLSPYQNKWVIKARVTAKGAIRTWSNAKGEGKLFSMDLMDESGQIRVTAFRDQVDKFYDMIEVDKVYYISKGQFIM